VIASQVLHETPLDPPSPVDLVRGSSPNASRSAIADRSRHRIDLLLLLLLLQAGGRELLPDL
jgi:hypothetical protein